MDGLLFVEIDTVGGAFNACFGSFLTGFVATDFIFLIGAFSVTFPVIGQHDGTIDGAAKLAFASTGGGLLVAVLALLVVYFGSVLDFLVGVVMVVGSGFRLCFFVSGNDCFVMYSFLFASLWGAVTLPAVLFSVVVVAVEA